MLNIDFKQPSTCRGLVRLMVAGLACYFWLVGDNDRAIGAFTFGTALNGWLGLKND